MYLEAQLYAIGGKKYDEVLSCGTAAVTKDALYVSKKFEDTLNDVEKQFLLDHEMMHLLLKHHSRFPNCTQEDQLGTDAAINSILRQQYCGDKDPIGVIPKLYSCGIFPDKYEMPEGMTADWYTEAFASKTKQQWIKFGFGGGLNPENKETEEKLEGASSGILGGMGGFSDQVRQQLKSGKVYFAQFVKDLVGNKSAYNGFGLVERFGQNRRNPSSILPTERFGEGHVKIRKNKILLFLDYSGSCQSMKPLFEQAAAQIPKGFYDIDTFLFASSVARDGYGIGSGTCFCSVGEEAKEHKYDQVWIFTDGYGNGMEISESNRKKWRWFLQAPPGYPAEIIHIPKGCNIHFLSQFVIEETNEISQATVCRGSRHYFRPNTPGMGERG